MLQFLCEEMVLIDHGNILEKGIVNTIIDKYSKRSAYVEGKEINIEVLQIFGQVINLGKDDQVVGTVMFVFFTITVMAQAFLKDRESVYAV